MRLAMETITYSLRDGRAESDIYYRDIAAFADEVLAEVEGRVGRLPQAYRSYLEDSIGEEPRTHPEYALELLALGVLWQVYAVDALALPSLPRRVLTGLARLRERGGWLKPGADFLRGMLATPFLAGGGRPAEVATPKLEQLDRLLGWLGASGIFDQEVKRLAGWRDFLAGQPAEETAAALAAVAALAAWFQVRSEAALGHYTPHVERFLAETHPRYRWRHDALFCGRRRVEYHLNMVGTEILNRAFRAVFLATVRKVVLVPPCMQAPGEGRCQASPTPYGARCAGCTPACRVHQLTKLGEKYGFAVLILPEELTVFSTGAVQPMDRSEVGVVGVSCALTNLSGGWETRELGIPAQGVLLDYCGCRWHWHKEGVPTATNVDQVLRVLGIAATQK
jgi:hypothetical protein